MHDMTPHNLTKNALSDASHSVFEIVHKSLICLVKNVNSLYFTNYQEPQQICILKFWHRDKRQRTSPDTAMFVSFMYFLSFFFFWKYMQFIKSYRASPTCHASKLKYPTGFFRWQQGCVDHFVDTADPLPPPPPPRLHPTQCSVIVRTSKIRLRTFRHLLVGNTPLHSIKLKNGTVE